MRLSAETHHLLEKRLRQALQPAEILGCAVLSTFVFLVVFISCVFGVRYHNNSLAVALVGVCIAFCAGLILIAGLKFRSSKPSRSWIALASCAWTALAFAYLIGNRYWHENMVSYYYLQEMASYVNIDPAMDKGQSYMDAGTVYFKEGSYVLRGKSIAFRNGLTYCVAPIVRAPVDDQAGSGAPETTSGFVMPHSGTVDFWAVGTDCCGRDGNTFNCGEVASRVARSGMRSLDDTARSMYLLAVQEWSATTGLPVRHPLFFNWVKDPLRYQSDIISNAWQDFWLHVTGYFVASLVFSFLLHAIMQKLRIH